MWGFRDKRTKVNLQDLIDIDWLQFNSQAHNSAKVNYVSMT